MWERHRDVMQAALAQHHLILRHSIESNAGHVFNIVGDAFCAAFATAPTALAAAVAAGRLCGAADALLHAMRTQMLPYDQEQYERNLAALRAQLDPVAFDAALADGRTLTLDQAIALALEA